MGREFANIRMSLGMCDGVQNDREDHSNFPSQLLGFFFKGSTIHHDKIMQKEDLIVVMEKLIMKGYRRPAQNGNGHVS